MGNALLKAAEAADQQISAIHAAFGAPGDHGYESREGKALYELYKFQVELRAVIRQALIDDVRAGTDTEKVTLLKEVPPVKRNKA